MRTLLRRLFIENWQRKLLSLILAMVVWMIVNHSMSTTKTIHNIPVKVKNIPKEKTIDGLQSNGIMNKRISLSITGNKSVIDDLTGDDIAVVIDASHKESEWIASITKKNLVSLSSNLSLGSISKVNQHDFIVKMSNLASEKIPVLVTTPIGEAPKGYQFLDIWPYQLYITLKGPEDIIKRLKSRGIKLTFNLNEINRDELDNLHKETPLSNEISYHIPTSWKRISIPYLSEIPFEIDDESAKNLHIDFLKKTLIPIKGRLPVSLFFPNKYAQNLNPETYSLNSNEFIENVNGISMITPPLFAQGVSRLFMDIVQEMIQIVIIVAPQNERKNLLWNAQFIYPHELEDLFVARSMLENIEDMVGEKRPQLREEYLRNRFRSFMNHFRLYTSQEEKLSLDIELKENAITVSPKNTF